MASPPTLLTTPAFSALLDALVKLGRDPGPIAAQFGLAGNALPVGRVGEFADTCNALAGDPLFTLRVALALPRGTFGPAEFIWRTAPTAQEAWRSLQRYQRLVSEIFSPQLREVGADRVRLVYAVPPPPFVLGTAGHQFVVGSALRLLLSIAGEEQRPLRVGFAHPVQERAEEIERLVRAPIAFDQLENWLEFDRSLFSRTTMTADPPLFKVLTRLLDRLQAELERPDDFLGQVERAIGGLLSQGEVSVGEVAKGLRMSPRTLQRRLQLENTNHRAMVELVRRRKAHGLVVDPSIPLSEVSWRLGFSQFTAFARAFHRWTGETPTTVRQRSVATRAEGGQ